MRVVVLESTPMIHAPSVIRWLMSGYWVKGDRKKLRKVAQSWDGLTSQEWHKVLSGKIPCEFVGDSVKIRLKD